MNNQVCKTIKLNRKGLFINIVLLVIANVITFYMILNSEKFVSTFFRNKEFIFVVGILGFIYFLILLIARCFILINTEDAFIINEKFMVDNTTYESLGKIKWDDIQSIETKNTFNNNKYIEIKMKSGYRFLEAHKLNFFQRILIFMKNWNYKSTIIISHKFLKIKFQDLESIINKCFEEYEKNKTNK